MIFASISFFHFFLILFLSFIISFFLYFFREKRLKDLSIFIKFFLFVLRFGTCFLILILLLNPYIENKKEIIEKPIFVIFQDNSFSIISNKDSSFYKSDYKDSLNEFLISLKNNLNVEFFLFGNHVRNDSISFDDKFSDISSIFNYSEDIFSHSNVGGYLLLSDGIFNKGKNPLYIQKKLNAPLYCLALGDTNKLRDLSIHSIDYNKIGFPGNELPVELTFRANNLKGEKIKLIVKSKKNKIYESVIDIETMDYFKTISFYVRSKKAGLNKFDVSISLISSEKEHNINNNFSSFYIDIVNKEKDILMLYEFPHPDVVAIKSAIQLDQQYQIDVVRASDFKKDITKYDLVILYQCDSLDDEIQQIKKNNIPIWYIIGQQSNFSKINKIQNTIYFNEYASFFYEVFVSSNQFFEKFNLGEDVLQMISNSPPLINTKGFSLNGDVKVLFNEKSMVSSEENPICFFAKNNQECFLISEGIWRWRLNNFLQKSNHNSFNTLIIQIVKNLLIKNNKDRFRLNYRSVSDFGESLIFDAELYDENLEKIPNKDINLSLKNSENVLFEYSFISIGDEYVLNIGQLNPGDYQFVAKTNHDGKTFSKKGSFLVKNSLLEKKNTVANHNLLYNLSKQHDGYFFHLSDMNIMQNKILNSDNYESLIHYESEKTSLYNSIVPLILILFFLILEWFCRKKFIGY